MDGIIKMKRESKTIYIQNEYWDIWEKIKAEANNKKVGIGFLLLSIWAEKNKVEMKKSTHYNQYTKNEKNK